MPTISSTINNSIYDAHSVTDGTSGSNRTNTTIQTYTDTGTGAYTGCFTFTSGVTVPNAATIIDARFKGYLQPFKGSGGVVDLDIHLDPADNSSNCPSGASSSTTSGSAGVRNKTSASVAWFLDHSADPSIHLVTSPNIAAPVQEVVNRAGWASGNWMSVLLRGRNNQATARLTLWTAYDGNSAQAAVLQITYNRAPNAPGAFTNPTGGTVTGTISVAWGTATDPDGDTVYYTLDFYNGSSWSQIAYGSGINPTSFNSTLYSNGSGRQFRVSSYDGIAYSAYTYSNTFTISNSQTVSPGGIASAEAFGNPTVVRGSVTLSNVGGISSAEALGVVTLQVRITLSPGGVASGETFGNPDVYQAFLVAPDSIASLEAFGNPIVIPGSITLQPSGIGPEEAFGNLVLQTIINLLPVAIASVEVFGNVTVLPGSLTLQPAGAVTAEGFGSPTLALGSVTVQPVGAVSSEAFGNPTIQTLITLITGGIPSAEAFGVITLETGPVYLAVTGIASSEALGIPYIVPPGVPWIFVELSDQSLLLIEMPEIELVNNTGWVEVLGTDEHIEHEENI